LKLLIFSDIHGNWKELESLMEIDADYYIGAGDFVNWGKNLDRAGEILRRRHEKMYVIPGNHESAGQIASLCARFELHDFHEHHLKAGNWHVAGLGYSNPTPFNTPGEYSEAQLAERLQRFTTLSPVVLVCHVPPYGTPLDRIRPGLHAGSHAVRQFIDRHQPEYFFSGHIHEAAGTAAELGRTHGWNAGPRGYLLELE
jgi:Icc-related predicted phosphoesterase